MKIKFPTRPKSFKKGGLHTNPGFFWQILLVLALFMIVASFVFGFFLFRKINKDPAIEVDKGGAKAQKAREQRVDKVLEYFSERKSKSLDILNAPSPIGDPSI